MVGGLSKVSKKYRNKNLLQPQSKLDLLDLNKLKKFIKKNKPDVVISALVKLVVY